MRRGCPFDLTRLRRLTTLRGVRYLIPITLVCLLGACGGDGDGPLVGIPDVGDTVEEIAPIDLGGAAEGGGSLDVGGVPDADDVDDAETDDAAAPDDVEPDDTTPDDTTPDDTTPDDTAPDDTTTSNGADAGDDVPADAEPDTDGGLDGDDGADGDPPCEGEGCGCASDEECAGGLCVPGAVGTLCAAPCDTICLAPAECVEFTTDGDETPGACLDGPTCVPCDGDEDCGRGAACDDSDDGRFCAPPCGPDGRCRTGFACVTLDDERTVCAPSAGACAGCGDEDEDGFVAREVCGGDDCDDEAVTVFPGAEELCNERDDDCDDEVDEGFELTTDPAHCGACEHACVAVHADVVCEESACLVLDCTEGFTDCNLDGVDGCEVELLGPNGCGECGVLDGDPCGTCGSGTMACAEGEQTCVADLGPLARNECGGCEFLRNVPGERCGECDTGIWACDGADALVCDGDLGEDALNRCGGCELLDDGPGDRCGTCGSGTTVCEGPNATLCAGDLGEEALNACGGCARLPGTPGEICGTCDTGIWECESPEVFTCVGDAGPDRANGCGGCDTLTATPGDPCGECEDGEWTCVGEEAVDCVGAIVPGPDGCPPPECEGREPNPVGTDCLSDGECCSGECLRITDLGVRVCSDECSVWSDCNPPDAARQMFCSREFGATPLCAIDDWGAPCTNGAGCVGNFCVLRAPEDGICTWTCDERADCRDDHVCGIYAGSESEFRACTRMGDHCTEPDQCRSNICLTGVGADYCTTYCDDTDPDFCPSGYTCRPIRDGERPICMR